MPNMSVLQPDSTQTFMVKPSYSGTEYYFTAAELMAFVKASYPACDSLILLPYAYSSFGYFIGYFTIGTVNDLNFRNEDLDIAMNCWVAHDALNATTVSFAAINNDGTGLGNQMGSGVSWSTLTDQSTSKTWLHIDASFNEPLVLYTECNYTTLYINGVAPTPPGPTPVLWEQILFGNSVLFSEGTIVNFDACENSWTWRQQDQQELDNINQYLTGEMVNSRQLPAQTTEVYRKGSYYITICQELPSSTGPGIDIIFGKDGETPQLVFSSGANGNKQQGYKFAIAINETNQQGAFVGAFITYDNYYAGVGRWLSNTSSASTATNLYNWLKAAKPEKATVRVNYYLPDYDYTYAKITYKKDDKPASETDGTSVEILKDESSVDISGLSIGANYWFTIFTDKSESEAFPFSIGGTPPSPEPPGSLILYDNGTINDKYFDPVNYRIVHQGNLQMNIQCTLKSDNIEIKFPNSERVDDSNYQLRKCSFIHFDNKKFPKNTYTNVKIVMTAKVQLSKSSTSNWITCDLLPCSSYNSKGTLGHTFHNGDYDLYGKATNYYHPLGKENGRTDLDNGHIDETEELTMIGEMPLNSNHDYLWFSSRVQNNYEWGTGIYPSQLIQINIKKIVLIPPQ